MSALPQETRDFTLIPFSSCRDSKLLPKGGKTAWAGSWSRAGQTHPSAGTSAAPWPGTWSAEGWNGKGEGARDGGIPRLAAEGERVAAFQHSTTLLLHSELNVFFSHKWVRLSDSSFYFNVRF